VKTPNNRAPIMTARAADAALRRYLDARVAGARLSWARAEAHLSRSELGAYAGMSPSTIHRIETGERRMTPAERAVISRALGVGLATLAIPAIELGPASSNGNGRAAA